MSALINIIYDYLQVLPVVVLGINQNIKGGEVIYFVCVTLQLKYDYIMYVVFGVVLQFDWI